MLLAQNTDTVSEQWTCIWIVFQNQKQPHFIKQSFNFLKLWLINSPAAILYYNTFKSTFQRPEMIWGIVFSFISPTSDSKTSASQNIRQHGSHLTSCPVTYYKTTHSKPKACWGSKTGQKGGCDCEGTADLFPITELKQHAGPIVFMYIFLAVSESEYVVFCYHRESSSTSDREHIISFWGFTITAPDSDLLVLSVRRHSKHAQFSPTLWERK